MRGYVILYLLDNEFVPEISEIVFRTREEAEEHLENIQERLWNYDKHMSWWDIRRVVVMNTQ